MTTTDPGRVLLVHNRWATGNVLDACAQLSEEQFHQTFEMGLGSLHDTLTHVLGAMQGWTDVLTGGEIRVRLEDGKRSAAELAELLGSVADELDAAVQIGSASDIVRRERGGKEYAFTRGGVLTHVTTHGVHHRAQCLNMLRQLGAEKLPMSSVMEWMLFGEPVG